MQYDFNLVIDRLHSDSDKWNNYNPDVLPLWVADMDFPSPQPVVQALHQRVEHSIFGYASSRISLPGDEVTLSEVLVDRMQRLYNWNITVEDLVFLPGVVTGINQMSHALAIPDGQVLVQTPVYPPILHTAQTSSMLTQSVPLTLLPDGQYELDYAAFEAAISPMTRLFVLCNPHNPVGRVFRRNELERMAEICLRHGVVICSDEIHCDLLFNGNKHIPIASLSDEVAQNTVTLMAPSKTFNIAGLKCSIAIIQNPQLRQTFRKAGQGLVSSVNLLGLTAALAAYRFGQDWLDQLLLYLQDNRDFLVAYVKDQLPDVKMASPQGTYLAWLDCRSAGLPESPYKFFLEQARVALNDGSTFGPGGEGFVRLNFGCPRSTLTDALERMKASLHASGHMS